LLQTAGISMLRYPGGSYSDFYHWFNNTLVPQAQPGEPGACNQVVGGAPAPNCGYLARDTDFGHFVQLLASTSTVGMITVNYGSNPTAGGPATPQEAAAWVAYANGDPTNQTLIGVDSTGRDWKTVSYWASLRAATPLAADDGMNFLRIGQQAPVGIQYWEIGNEIYGNGYYGAPGWEEDLHAAYNTTGSTDRFGNAALSPREYGDTVLEFVAAMKAVDPTIQIGAVLDMTLADTFFNDWNATVLDRCAAAIDFGIVHYYPNHVTGGIGGVVDQAATLADPRNIASELSSLRTLLVQHGGSSAATLPLAVTEAGPVSFTSTITDPTIHGLLATDAYLTLLENGIFNVAWLELHNGTFLTPSQGRGPAYYGIQLSHLAAAPGDTLVQATSTVALLRAHAAKRADGSVAVTLINDDPSNSVLVQLNFTGVTLPSSAVRYDWGKSITPPSAALAATTVNNPANGMQVPLQAYSATTLVFGAGTASAMTGSMEVRPPEAVSAEPADARASPSVSPALPQQ
jgi:hypothetical protein